MEWVLIVVLLVLLIGGFVAFLVVNASKKSGPVADGSDEGPPGIGADDTPLGDTSEHAGETTEHGTTAGGQDAEEAGGTGRPVHSGSAETSAAGEDAADPDAAAHIARPGEGEGAVRLEFEGRQPAAAATGQGDAPDAPAQSEEEADEAVAGMDLATAEAQAAESREPEEREGSRQATESDEATRPASERLADRGF